MKTRSGVRTIAFDFLFGGALVAGALLVAALLGPTSGGILAGPRSGQAEWSLCITSTTETSE